MKGGQVGSHTAPQGWARVKPLLSNGGSKVGIITPTDPLNPCTIPPTPPSPPSPPTPTPATGQQKGRIWGARVSPPSPSTTQCHHQTPSKGKAQGL